MQRYNLFDWFAPKANRQRFENENFKITYVISFDNFASCISNVGYLLSSESRNKNRTHFHNFRSHKLNNKQIFSSRKKKKPFAYFDITDINNF